ncbi:unnamed protein product, partial [Gongylonema pulchrum]|uniref:Piezo_RRas_bdg domain-containing protein n=1 Tax=Gongylonema pulchrum TaxID=637853 RepID=A0A183EM48_9BILA
GSASECSFVSLLAARFEVLKELRQRFPFVEEGLLLSKLVAYCSKEFDYSSVMLKSVVLFVFGALRKTYLVFVDVSRGET